MHYVQIRVRIFQNISDNVGIFLGVFQFVSLYFDQVLYIRFVAAHRHCGTEATVCRDRSLPCAHQRAYPSQIPAVAIMTPLGRDGRLPCPGGPRRARAVQARMCPWHGHTHSQISALT